MAASLNDDVSPPPSSSSQPPMTWDKNPSKPFYEVLLRKADRQVGPTELAFPLPVGEYGYPNFHRFNLHRYMFAVGIPLGARSFGDYETQFRIAEYNGIRELFVFYDHHDIETKINNLIALFMQAPIDSLTIVRSSQENVTGLSHNLFVSLLKNIAPISRLSRITLCNYNLGKDEMDLLGKFIKQTPTMKDLQFHEMFFGNTATAALVDFLATSHGTLTNLTFSFCKFREFNFAGVLVQDAFNKIARALIQKPNEVGDFTSIDESPGLQYLAVDSCSLTVRDTEGLLKYLRAPSCALRVLELTKNNIGPVRGAQIINALIENKTLLELDLSGDREIVGSGMELATLILKNTTLQRLNFSKTSIEHGVAIAKALSKNNTLSEFFIDCHDLSGDAVGTIFAKVLPTTKSLKHLSILCNPTTLTAHLDVVVKSFRANTTIVAFEILYTPLIFTFGYLKHIAFASGTLQSIYTIDRHGKIYDLPLPVYNRLQGNRRAQHLKQQTLFSLLFNTFTFPKPSDDVVVTPDESGGGGSAKRQRISMLIQ